MQAELLLRRGAVDFLQRLAVLLRRDVEDVALVELGEHFAALVDALAGLQRLEGVDDIFLRDFLFLVAEAEVVVIAEAVVLLFFLFLFFLFFLFLLGLALALGGRLGLGLRLVGAAGRATATLLGRGGFFFAGIVAVVVGGTAERGDQNGGEGGGNGFGERLRVEFRHRLYLLARIGGWCDGWIAFPARRAHYAPVPMLSQ